MKKLRLYYLALGIMTIAYALCTVLLPMADTTQNRFGLSGQQVRIISLTVVIPYALIWFVAFYGFIKVKQYARTIGDSKDGKILGVLSNGLMLLALSLPLNALMGTLRSYVNYRWPDATPATTIAYNYFTLVLTLGGIWLVAHAARGLSRSLIEKKYGLNQAILGGIFTAFCFVYGYVTLTDPARRVPGSVSGIAAYYLPDVLVFATIVIPYICVWYLGLRAAYHIQLYRKNAPGVLYRKALGNLGLGIAFVITSLMVLRLLTSMSSFLNTLSLRLLLMVIYALLIIIGVGYGFIASGAKRLKKIEEV